MIIIIVIFILYFIATSVWWRWMKVFILVLSQFSYTVKSACVFVFVFWRYRFIHCSVKGKSGCHDNWQSIIEMLLFHVYDAQMTGFSV